MRCYCLLSTCKGSIVKTFESKHCGSCFYRDLQSQCGNCEATLSMPTKWIDRSIYIDSGIKIPAEDLKDKPVEDVTAYKVFKQLEARLITDSSLIGKYQKPLPRPTPTLGVKYDSSKPRWSLLPWKQTSEVVEVLTLGSEKYADDNWKVVPNAPTRYLDAALRHITAWTAGERTDTETGKSHLAHAVCCLLFMMWFDDNKKDTK